MALNLAGNFLSVFRCRNLDEKGVKLSHTLRVKSCLWLKELKQRPIDSDFTSDQAQAFRCKGNSGDQFGIVTLMNIFWKDFEPEYTFVMVAFDGQNNCLGSILSTEKLKGDQ